MNASKASRPQTLIGPLLMFVGTALLWAIYPIDPLFFYPLSLITVATTLMVRFGWLRPITDAVAWIAVIVMIATIPETDRVLIELQTLPLTVLALTAIITGIHIPPQASARVGPTMGFPGWLLVVTIISIAAWWPTLRAPAGNIIIWDPMSPTGAAIRVLGLLVLLALVSGILSASSLLVAGLKEEDGTEPDSGKDA